MYNEQIEGLIKAALADGELTEKEKQILFKRAEAMGIDLDEFEMVLDARLVELKQQEAAIAREHELAMAKAQATTAQAAATQQSAAPKSNKYGDVRKCPVCGAMIQSFQAKCPECDYEFTNIEANSSVQRLSEMLRKIDAEYSSKAGIFSTISSMLSGTSLAERKRGIISSFPIPKTKEDILEFITFLAPKAKKIGFWSNASEEEKVENKAYRQKLEEVLMKAKFMLKTDAEATATIEAVAKQVKINK